MRSRFVTKRIWSPYRLLGLGLVIAMLLVVPARVARPTSQTPQPYPPPHGTVSVLQVRGPADTDSFPVWVWRPPGPDSASIPVVYFLHGYPGGAGDAFGSGLADILDRRLAEGYPPVVVACPDGNGEHHKDTEWANAWNGSDRVMSRVVADIAAVEGKHRRPTALRVIAGFSMGGYGAMNIAMQNRGLFGSVVTIAGYFVLNDLSDMFSDIPGVMRANDPSAHPGRARGVNVILEEDAEDPLSLVRGQAAWMASLLQRAGVPATVAILPGSHSWSYALRAFQDALNDLDEDWARAAALAAVRGLTAVLDPGQASLAVASSVSGAELRRAWQLVAEATGATSRLFQADFG